LELIPEDDADLRRDVVKKRALAAAAAMHIPDMARQQRRADGAPA
jgi:hypothetical protein